MTSEGYKWLANPPKWALAAAVPLTALGFAAAAVSWKLGRPREVQKFHADGLTRPLSDLDRWYSGKNLAHMMPNFYIATMLTGKPWTRKEAEILLSRVMVRHAPSMCSIVDKDDAIHEPYWRRLWHPSYASDEQGIMDIQFETRASDEENDETWKSVALRHETDGFSVARSQHTLFRLIIVSKAGCPHFELIFLPHHAICDGRGAAHFVRQLLEEYELFEAEGDAHAQPIDLTQVVIHDADIRLLKNAGNTPTSTTSKQENGKISVAWPPALENTIRTTPGLWFLVKTFLADRFAFFRPESTAWLGPRDRGYTLRPTAIISWLKVPSSTISTLRRISRERGTTVNSTLWSAVIFALYRSYLHTISATDEPQTGEIGRKKGSTSKKPFVAFCLATAIDLRSKAGIPDSILSPQVAGTASYPVAHEEMEFWEVAKKIQKSISDEMPEAITLNGLIPWVQRPTVPWIFGKEARTPNGRVETVKMSNLGPINFEHNYGSTLRCRDVWFARHTVRDGFVFGITVMTPGINRDMNIGLTGTKELLSGTDVQEILQQTILDVLTRATANDSPNAISYRDIYP